MTVSFLFPFPLCLCLPWSLIQDLSFFIEGFSSIPAHGTGPWWSVDHRGGEQGPRLTSFSSCLGVWCCCCIWMNATCRKELPTGLVEQPESQGPFPFEEKIFCNGPAQPTTSIHQSQRRVPRRPLCQQFTLLWACGDECTSEDAHLFLNHYPICILFLLPPWQPQECIHFISPKLFCHDHCTRLSPGSSSGCLRGDRSTNTHCHTSSSGGPCALAEPLTMPPGIWGGFLQVVTSELRFTSWVRYSIPHPNKETNEK